jgi:hypothetical protein
VTECGLSGRGEDLPKLLLRKKTTGPLSFALSEPFVADERFELLLFHGLVGLHIHSAPRLTPHLASIAPRFTSLLTTGPPRSAPLFTPCHTGRCWSDWCCSGWCWSGWRCLSLSI